MLHAGSVSDYGNSSCPNIVVIPNVCQSRPDGVQVWLLAALCCWTLCAQSALVMLKAVVHNSGCDADNLPA